MIYFNFMNNQKLSNVGFYNKNQKFRTFTDYNVSSFESDKQSVVNVRSILINVKKKKISVISS